MKERCPTCGVVLNEAGNCWYCGGIFPPKVSPEVRRRRKVVDFVQKDPAIAEKVAKFLGIE